MKRIFLLSIIAVISLLFFGCGDSNIDLVKNGNFPGYATTIIGDMLDNAFEGTKWSSQENSKGEIVVLFEGKITQKMHDSKRNKLLQGFAEKGDNVLVTASNMARVLKDVFGKWVGPSEIENLLKECLDKYHPFTDYSATDDELKELEQAIQSMKQTLTQEIVDWERAQLKAHLEYAENIYALAKEQARPGWTEERDACGQKIIDQTEEYIDETYWAAGDIIFLEWKIHSDGKRFELSGFGGQTLPQGFKFSQFLETIYAE